MRDVSKGEFLKNREKQSAVIREIEIIGEAVKNLPLAVRKAHPDVPWIDIAGMRDKLMHHYFGVNLDTIWETVKSDLPGLKTKIQSIRRELEGASKEQS